MFLYVITNLVNGKQYVGITTNIAQRTREHYSGHGSKLVWQATRKYGRENLQLEICYEGDEAFIKLMETRTILALDTVAPHGYNLTLGGEGAIGWKPSPETLEKFRHRRNGMLGRKHSEEARARMRRACEQRPSNGAFRSFNEDAKGAKHPRARPVVIEGIEYGCIRDASIATGANVNTLYMRLRRCQKSGCWPVGWGFKTPV